MSIESSRDIQEPHDIVMIADGWTRSVFMDLYENGDLADIRTHLVQEGGLIYDVVSTVPSVSLLSHTTILAGVQPVEHRLPGHRWIERSSGKVVNYLTWSGNRRLNRDIGDDVTTFFEDRSLGSLALQSVINRGASRSVRIPSMRGAPIIDLYTRKYLDDYRKAVIWLPRVDALSHSDGPRSDRVRAEMIATSRAIGNLARQMHANGQLDRARIALVPDHGHRPVERSVSLANALSGLGVAAATNPRVLRLDQATVMTSGDASAQVYLPEHLQSSRVDIAGILAATEGVELVALREGDVWRFSDRDGVSFATVKPGHSASYHVLRGRDPLGLTTGDLVRVLDLTAPTVDERYPDLLHQIGTSVVPGRSGDIFAFAAEGTHFGVGPRVGFRLGFHRGSHGGLSDDEVLVACPFRNPREIDLSPVRSSDLLRRLGMLSTREAVDLGRDKVTAHP